MGDRAGCLSLELIRTVVLSRRSYALHGEAVSHLRRGSVNTFEKRVSAATPSTTPSIPDRCKVSGEFLHWNTTAGRPDPCDRGKGTNGRGGNGELEIKVLGASGSEAPGHGCPAFLIDGRLLLDAGTIACSLDIREECGIRHILLTHAHFDHFKGIPFLLDNRVIRNSGNAITVVSGRDVLDELKNNIFNDRIWPDFSRIPSPAHPVLKYRAVVPSRPVTIDGYRVVLERVDHSVPAYGFIVEDSAKKAVAYTGDTGPTDRFWKKMAAHDVKCVIVETSFPNRLETPARMFGHLTPALLEQEIAKMPGPPSRIFVVHLKPHCRREIQAEIEALGRRDIEVLKEGDVLDF